MNKNKIIIILQYIFYYGLLGIYLPYFNLYCLYIGLNGFQIGLLSSLRSISFIIFPLFWGILADRFNIRKQIYIICAIMSSCVWFFYIYATNFKFMLLIMAIYGIFYSPIIPFLDALTIDLLGKEKKKYGNIRAWGTISFIIIVIGIGKIIDVYSIEIVITLIFIWSLAQSITSMIIPNISIHKEKSASDIKKILTAPYIIFLICAFLMLVSHGTYYGFFSIHLKLLGYGNTYIGINWAVASIAEIFVMVNSDKIFKKFSIEQVLFVSIILAVFRWLMLYYGKSLWVIMISQILHAATYGTFHISSILYIDKLTPASLKTLGQAINNGIMYGLGLMIGFLLNGYLFKQLGTFNLFLLSSFIALISFIFFIYDNFLKRLKASK